MSKIVEIINNAETSEASKSTDGLTDKIPVSKNMQGLAGCDIHQPPNPDEVQNVAFIRKVHSMYERRKQDDMNKKFGVKDKNDCETCDDYWHNSEYDYDHYILSWGMVGEMKTDRAERLKSST